MKRKVYATVQVLCDGYEDRFNEKVATASLVNVLIAEALIKRGLIPKDFIQTEYGCKDPLNDGFTAFARKEKPPTLKQLKEMQDLEQQKRYFQAIYETEWETHPNIEWRTKVLEKAAKYKDQITFAKMLLEVGHQ